jgi:hypothetical protein
MARVWFVVLLTTAALFTTGPALAVEDYTKPQIEALYLAESLLPNRLVTQYTPTPPNQTWIYIRHMGDVGTEEHEQQIAHRVYSDRSAMTGLDVGHHPLVARWFFQRGYVDIPEYGFNVYQVYGRSFGWHVNTWSFGHDWPIECPELFPECQGGPNIAYSRAFTPGLEPWRTNSSEFTMQVYIRLPWVHYDHDDPPVAQINLGYYLVHKPTGYGIAGLIGLFDTRPHRDCENEGVSTDGISTFVASQLGDAQPNGEPYRFATRSPYSWPTQFRYRWDGERFFRAHITWENLENILEEAEAPGIPSEYEVVEAFVLIEAFPRWAGNVSFAGSLRYFELYRFHDDD